MIWRLSCELVGDPRAAHTTKAQHALNLVYSAFDREYAILSACRYITRQFTELVLMHSQWQWRVDRLSVDHHLIGFVTETGSVSMVSSENVTAIDWRRSVFGDDLPSDFAKRWGYLSSNVVTAVQKLIALTHEGPNVI